MIDAGVARESDFTGPELDEGELLYRSALGPRGCIFLLPERGCRLHGIGFKPEICRLVPRDQEEVDEMAADDMLPCHASWKWSSSTIPSDLSLPDRSSKPR